MDFDDLNPPLAPPPKSDPFFGCLALILLILGIVALLRLIS